jgi:hypothetical protein
MRGRNVTVKIPVIYPDMEGGFFIVVREISYNLVMDEYGNGIIPGIFPNYESQEYP